MEFVKIQNKITKEITQYRVNGARVTRAAYNQFLDNAKGQQCCFLTKRTKLGNFRHSFYTTGIL